MTLRRVPSDHKVPVARPSGFDDQIWSVYALTGILSASAVAIVVSYSEFPRLGTFAWNDSIILSTGWFRLVSVGFFVAAAVGIVHFAERWMDRRVLFCVLFGMLLHLWGGVFLHDQMLSLWARIDSSAEDEMAELPDDVTMPDYHSETIERDEIPEIFEKPVPTTAAEESRVEPVEQQAAEHEAELETPPPVAEEADDRQVPKPLDPARAERPAPGEMDELARIEFEREHFIDRPEVSEPLPMPEIRPAKPVEAESAPTDVVEPMERRQRRSAIPDRPMVQAETSPANPVADATAVRRTSRSAPILVESAIAGIPRRFSGTEMVPRTDLTVPDVITNEPQPPSSVVDFAPGITQRRQLDPRFEGATPKAQASNPGRSTPPMIASRRTGSAPSLATTSAGPVSIGRAEMGVPSLPPVEAAGWASEGISGSGAKQSTVGKGVDRTSAAEDGVSDLAGGPMSRVQRVDFAAPVHRPGAGGLREGTSGAGRSGAGALGDRGASYRLRRGEGDLAVASSTRLSIPRSGVRPSMEGRAIVPGSGPFGQRDPRRRLEKALKHGGTPATEEAVELGLAYFARYQFPDGHWSLDRPLEPGANENAPGVMNADTAATGLALLSFLGAGYTHQDGKYHRTVRRGLDWLRANQADTGQLYTEATDGSPVARMYGHGIAAIAVCEAYGMTRDKELRWPAEAAVWFTRHAQHPVQGGWRYVPGLESDTSVSGWHLMALKSARMAGLEVPTESWERVSHWLDTARSADGARYAYNPYALDNDTQRKGRVPSLAMTAEGLLMRFYLGWDGENPAAIAGADYLAENLPQLGTAERPLRNSYYWYYGTQVMFQMQGEHWQAWNGRIRPLLVEGQEREGQLAGSWDPHNPLPDRWATSGGRNYLTALNLLMLEVYYRHLPLFKTLGEGG